MAIPPPGPGKSKERALRILARELCNSLQRAGRIASKEEEVRIAAERALAVIQRESGVKIEGEHEYTIGTGRIDSVYGCVIIEYKNPASPSSRLTLRPESATNGAVITQIKQRFAAFQAERRGVAPTMLGVGCDGRVLIFVRLGPEGWIVEDPQPVSERSSARLLWALSNLGVRGKALSAEELAKDFGAGTSRAVTGVRALYEAITVRPTPKATVLLEQWQLLFGEVAGYDVNLRSDRVEQTRQAYKIPSPFDPGALQFAIHTYYAILMKLLAAEIVAYYQDLPSPLGELIRAESTGAFRDKMADLERGGIFQSLGIRNFLEGDLFTWYLDTWDESLDSALVDVVAGLDSYNPGTLSEDPRGSRDLLKRLYTELFPQQVRHNLGEYYTPDWLAEELLRRSGYDGSPETRIVDPACGSGTFLVLAIERALQWYEANRSTTGLTEIQFLERVQSNVVGFDLNPLAVMASRTNVLIALRDFLGLGAVLEVPVYLCDSILTPVEYGGLEVFDSSRVPSKSIRTSAAVFILPREVVRDRRILGEYTELLESAVSDGLSAAQFLEVCAARGVPIEARGLHETLFTELSRLARTKRNGIWARVLRNAFAPVFSGRFDIVIGNPPWINWDALPGDYRRETYEVWKHYKLFSHRGLRARLGSAEDDISVLMTYVSIDRFLKDHGTLAFLITQSLFQTKGGGVGFRRFQIDNKTPFRVREVHDLTALQPFEGAANRTSFFVARKSGRTTFPVPYTVWTTIGRHRVTPAATLEAALDLTKRELRFASPVDSADPTSAWLVASGRVRKGLAAIAGPSDYRARVGVHPLGANGVFWIRVEREIAPRLVLITNTDLGRRRVGRRTAGVEPDLLYPLVRGRDVQKWSWRSQLEILLPHDPSRPALPMSQREMRLRYPKTLEFLKLFKSSLVARESKIIREEMDASEFYALYAVGPYTFGAHKVVWKELSVGIDAAVISDYAHPILGRKSVVVDHKLTAVECDSSDEAHYVCAVLNSNAVSELVESFVVSTAVSTHVLEHIPLRRYDSRSPAHRHLSALSQRCHELAKKGQDPNDPALTERINHLAGKVLRPRPQSAGRLI